VELANGVQVELVLTLGLDRRVEVERPLREDVGVIPGDGAALLAQPLANGAVFLLGALELWG